MLTGIKGLPKHIRSDNGSEFIAEIIREWLDGIDCETIYIEPGSPWENPYIESFNGKVRDECLNMNVFQNGSEAREVVGEWMREYNEFRPHGSLNYKTPKEFSYQHMSPRGDIC